MKARMRKDLSAEGLIRAVEGEFRGKRDDVREASCRYTLRDCLMYAFAMFKLKWPSLLRFEREGDTNPTLRRNLRRLFRVHRLPSDETVRQRLGGVDPKMLRRVFRVVFAKAQRGKALENLRSVGGTYLVAFDGTRTYQSKVKSCRRCCRTEHADGSTTYFHAMLAGAVVHAEHQIALPVAVEPITNADGASKQDCELSAMRRALPRLRREHPKLPMTILGDALYACVPMVERLRSLEMNFLITAKEGSCKELFRQFRAYRRGPVTQRVGDVEQEFHHARNVPLSKSRPEVRVHVVALRETHLKRLGKDDLPQERNWVWITDHEPTAANVAELALAARSRWKIENNTFKTLKDVEGNRLTHCFGHGESHLHEVLVLLMMLSFLVDNLERHACAMFAAARERAEAFYMLWEKIRGLLDHVEIEDWFTLYDMVAHPNLYATTARRIRDGP